MSEPLPTLANVRYAIAKKLGEGGQAATFEAVDKRAGALVVLKRFRVRGASSWKEVELAEREAKVLASLDHENLPSYVEHFEENGELWLVTKKIEGESLAEKRARGGAFSSGQVVQFLADAQNALDYLHSRSPPVIHRDIKPSNVIIRPDGTFALIDFGSVRDRLKPAGGSTVVGTFGYMAPEQFQGRAMAGSDVYAVGVTALVMLTGIDPEDLPHKGLAIDVAAALRGSTVPREIIRALGGMLDPDPDKRVKRVPSLDAKAEKVSDGKRDWTKPREAPDLVDAWKRDADRRKVEKKSRDDERRESSPWRELREGSEVFKKELREGGQILKKEFERERDRIREATEDWTKKELRHYGRYERREEKRDKKRERRLERVRERKERRDFVWRYDHLAYVDQWQRARRRHEAVPRLLLGPALLGLTIAELAAALALRVVVPSLLFFLSLVFGNALREAARNVNKAGKKVARRLTLIRRVMLQRDAEEHGKPEVSAGVRVAKASARVRVASPEKSAEDAEIEAEAEREADEAARGVRR